MAVFLLWMALGVIYGMVYEKWNFITALYFAVTSCSTAGLLGPPCENIRMNGTQYCDLGLNRAALSGVYGMFGVPSKELLDKMNF
jgi:hypothetical protein